MKITYLHFHFGRNMLTSSSKIKIEPVHFLYISLVIAIPAFLINLGLLPFIDDEAIRALVALEMILTDDYITPTLGGEIYLKKPPLYNWIISCFFKTFNNYSEFTMRLPAVISLLGFSYSIYRYTKKHVNKEIAILGSLMFLTCGRIIIYESLRGLIDICYSWLTFIMFMVIYNQYKKGNYPKLFILSYFITAITYLMKGLPSIVFIGITLLTTFISNKNFRGLFNKWHFAGISLFIGIVGTYYLFYFTNNDITIPELLKTLLGESTRRTAIRFGLLKTFIHLLSFPLDMIYHFLPWSGLLIFLFHKNTKRILLQNPFTKYLLLIFLINIFPYWTSPEVHPRYILMLIPILFILISFYVKNEVQKKSSRSYKIIEIILFGFMILISIICLLIPYMKKCDIILYTAIKTGVLFLLFSLTIYAYSKLKKYRLYTFAIFILIFKISFNLYVLPIRSIDSDAFSSRYEAEKLGKKTIGKELYTYWSQAVPLNKYYGKRIFEYHYLYYITRERKEILRSNSDLSKKELHLIEYYQYKEELFNTLDTLHPIGSSKPIFLGVPR